MAVGSSNDFDLVVLGAGTGGYSAAFRAAQLGLKVALVDNDKIGGTCLHIGCIPTKALLESAAFAERIRHAKDFGIGVGDPVIDYVQMAARRDQVVKRLWTGLKSLVDKNKVTWIQGKGRLDGPRNVRVQMEADADNPGGERVLQGTDVILATGSRVKSLPGLEPDGKRIITSDDVLTTNTLPKDVIVIGAGAVGVEFASMYQDLGVKVTLLEYLPTLVPLEDKDVSQALERSFTRRGMTVMTNARFDPKAVKVIEDRRLAVGRPGGEGGDRGLRGAAARRDGPGAERRGRRARDHEGRDREGLREGRPPDDANPRAAPLRDRRRRRRADARPHGRPRGPPRRAHDRRRQGHPPDGLRPAAAGDVLPPGDRVGRAHRAAVPGRRACRTRSARCRSRPSRRR